VNREPSLRDRRRPLPELLERIENLDPGASEDSVVARRDREATASGGRGDVVVFDRHALSGFIELALLLCPDVRNGHVEPMDAPVQGFHKPCQPGLEDLTSGLWTPSRLYVKWNTNGNADPSGMTSKSKLEYSTNSGSAWVPFPTQSFQAPMKENTEKLIAQISRAAH